MLGGTSTQGLDKVIHLQQEKCRRSLGHQTTFSRPEGQICLMAIQHSAFTWLSSNTGAVWDVQGEPSAPTKAQLCVHQFMTWRLESHRKALRGYQYLARQLFCVFFGQCCSIVKA